MLLSQLIDGSGCRLPASAPDPEITGVTADSREVGPGSVFVCIRGDRHDGHAFAARAIAAGAVAVIAERDLDVSDFSPEVPILRVADGRVALARCAANFFGSPDQSLELVGITGTNGKTTVSYLLEAIADAAGIGCGVVGTVGIRFAGKELPSSHTTPDAVALTDALRRMVDDGCGAAVVEVSSHALQQERVAGLHFAAAAFTNLSRDHLDFHGDMEAYFAAKARLFRERLGSPAFAGAGAGAAPLAVINGDDPWGVRLADSLGGEDIRSWRFSLQDPACELYADEVEADAAGLRATLRSPVGALSLRSPLVGAHNLQNLLCAAGIALGLGWPKEAVQRGLAATSGAPGRLERIEGRGIVAFVDYAHTDDALSRACAALNAVATGRLIVVFGCGGDRDRGKRPLMGEAAGRGAHLAIATSDNPRTEAPAAILDDILPGLVASGKERLSHEAALAGEDGFTVEMDRRRAIELAVAAAREGDLVLVAGKGHETWQILGDEKIHFDDREELRRLLLEPKDGPR